MTKRRYEPKDLAEAIIQRRRDRGSDSRADKPAPNMCARINECQQTPVAVIARDQHAIHFRCAEPPTANPNKYSDELLDAYLFIESADALYAEYAARGVEFTRGLNNSAWHCREFVVKDGINRRVLPRAQTLETELVLVIGKSSRNVHGEEQRHDLTNHWAKSTTKKNAWHGRATRVYPAIQEQQRGCYVCVSLPSGAPN